MKTFAFCVLALGFVANVPAFALGSGLSVTVEKQVCSATTRQCSITSVPGMTLDVHAKPDVSIGKLVASGVTGEDGKAVIELPVGTYQVLGQPVNGVCAYGWITGDPCIGPKFVVSPDRQITLTARYTIWTN